VEGVYSEMEVRIRNIAICAIWFLMASCTDRGHAVNPPDGPDTTSHNFVWQIQMLGDGISSRLYDVAIINDTLAYAVGEIYLKDSTGSLDPLLYNIARWNGSVWAAGRVSVLFRGSLITPSLAGIFAFSSSDIWLSSGVPIHGDGKQWEQFHLFDMGILTPSDGSVTRIWGSSSNSIYFVGNLGTVVYFDGRTWQKLSSGTTLPIQDIWGGVNASTGQTEILALASNEFEVPSGKKLLRIQNLTAIAVPDSGLPVVLSGLWFAPGKKYYVVGDGLFEKDHFSSTTPWTSFHQGLTTFFTEAIRGSGASDVFVVGHYGTVLHFNGSTWYNYQREVVLPNAILHSVAIKGNLSIAVGDAAGKGVVLVGRR
jgi:hypothetical protein